MFVVDAFCVSKSIARVHDIFVWTRRTLGSEPENVLDTKFKSMTSDTSRLF